VVLLDDARLAEDVPNKAVPARRSKLRLIVAAIVLAALAGAAGWLTPQLFGHHKPSYLGSPASSLASALGCTKFTRAAKHDESVYRYHDQGTCQLNGTVVTITTFDSEADGETFAAVMRAVIPILHPTWVGATYAAGSGWNVADYRNLTAAVAELAVRILGDGATHVIPSGKH